MERSDVCPSDKDRDHSCSFIQRTFAWGFFLRNNTIIQYSWLVRVSMFRFILFFKEFLSIILADKARGRRFGKLYSTLSRFLALLNQNFESECNKSALNMCVPPGTVYITEQSRVLTQKISSRCHLPYGTWSFNHRRHQNRHRDVSNPHPHILHP